MFHHVRSSVVFFLSWFVVVVAQRKKKRIAVVGAGLGGAATAYWLRKDHEVTVYEASSRVGGRVADHDGLELGASIVVSGNRLVVGLAEEMNLTLAKPPHVGGRFGLSDGSTFVYEESVLGALLRYGPRPLRRLKREVLSFFSKFEGIYELSPPKRTPREIWEALDLWNATTHTFDDHLRSILPMARKGSRRLISELVYAVNRVNYGQGNELNALAGCVSLCPAFSGQAILGVVGGNALLPTRLIEASGAALFLNTPVHDVTPEGRLSAAGRQVEDFDAVILAAPLDQIFSLRDKLPYQATHTTFVSGRCRRLSEAGLQTMLVVENSSDVVSSVSTYEPDLHKLFSRRRLSDDDLGALFDPGFAVVARKHWPAAYPIHTPFAPTEKTTPFQLGPRLYYVNTLEAATSALEIAAIAARNVASLVRRDLAGGLLGEKKSHHDDDTCS